MSSKVHWDASMGLEPINWPPASSVRPAQGSANLFPSRSLMPSDGQEGRPDGRTRQSEPDSERRAEAAYAQGHQDGVAAAQHETQAHVRNMVERLAHSIDELTGMRQRLR